MKTQNFSRRNPSLQATTIALCILGVALWLIRPLFAETQSTQPPVADDTRAYFEVLRSQFNADKIATYNAVLKLTPEEAKTFWPIYRNYEKELIELGDRKLDLIREFFKYHSSGTLTDERAKSIAEKWLANLEARTALWKKYHKQISKSVSPTRAAQFLQVENQLAIFIDLAIASEMPSITPALEKKLNDTKP